MFFVEYLQVLMYAIYLDAGQILDIFASRKKLKSQAKHADSSHRKSATGTSLLYSGGEVARRKSEGDLRWHR